MFLFCPRLRIFSLFVAAEHILMFQGARVARELVLCVCLLQSIRTNNVYFSTGFVSKRNILAFVGKIV